MITFPHGVGDVDDPEIVYIAGHGRSGSSALAALLGAHEEAFNGGELGQIPLLLERGGPCMCGVPVERCPVWGTAIRRIRALLGLRSRRTLDRLTAAFLPGAAAEKTGCRYLVDGSGTPQRHFLRPWLYHRLGYRVFIVHLIRRSRAGGSRGREGSDRGLHSSNGTGGHLAALRTVPGRIFANAAAAAYGLVFRGRYVRVVYEDLRADPARELERVGRVLGMDFSGVIRRLYRGVGFVLQHEPGGDARSCVLRTEPGRGLGVPRAAGRFMWPT